MKETQQQLVMEDTQETQQSQTQNLEDYLRDSIFGDDLRNYDEKFEQVTQEIENTQQNISDVESRLLKGIADVK